QHLDYTVFRLLVEEFRLLPSHRVDDFKRKLNVGTLVAKNPICASSKAVKQTTRPEKIHVSECGEEKESFDAAGKADQVQEEVPTFVQSLYFVQRLDRINPLETEIGLATNRWNIFNGVESLLALVEIGNVGIQQR